jgi:hypothetical protein
VARPAVLSPLPSELKSRAEADQVNRERETDAASLEPAEAAVGLLGANQKDLSSRSDLTVFQARREYPIWSSFTLI